MSKRYGKRYTATALAKELGITVYELNEIVRELNLKAPRYESNEWGEWVKFSPRSFKHNWRYSKRTKHKIEDYLKSKINS